MLDLSEEFDEENIATCVKYFKRMTAINQWLEMEIGITGGEEDGVNNENVDQEKLYTSPQQVIIVYYSVLMDYSVYYPFFRLLSNNFNFLHQFVAGMVSSPAVKCHWSNVFHCCCFWKRTWGLQSRKCNTST